MKKAAVFGKISWADGAKGFITAAITAIVMALYASLSATPVSLPTWPEGWKAIGLTGLAAGIAYLIKNVFTNSQNQFATKEPIPPPPTDETPATKG